MSPIPQQPDYWGQGLPAISAPVANTDDRINDALSDFVRGPIFKSIIETQYAGLFKDKNAVDVPTGTVVPFAGQTAPAKWLMCDGSEVTIADYRALYDVIRYGSWGAASIPANFKLPDLRGRVPAGKDNMGGTAATRVTTAVSGVDGLTLGASGGSQNMQQHNHPPVPNYEGFWQTDTAGSLVIQGGATYSANSLIATTGDAGTGASQNVQPTLILNYLIRT